MSTAWPCSAPRQRHTVLDPRDQTASVNTIHIEFQESNGTWAIFIRTEVTPCLQKKPRLEEKTLGVKPSRGFHFLEPPGKNEDEVTCCLISLTIVWQTPCYPASFAASPSVLFPRSCALSDQPPGNGEQRKKNVRNIPTGINSCRFKIYYSTLNRQ